MIHADRITGCTCEVQGDTATGVVSYKVPKLYQGQIEYVAKRKGDTWEITEFIMPVRKIHVVRSKKGAWELKEGKEARKE